MFVAEFKRRLDTNMGTFASGLWSRSRARVAPRRPKEGWDLLVKPLGEGGKGKEAYVAKPDGTKACVGITARTCFGRFAARVPE